MKRTFTVVTIITVLLVLVSKTTHSQSQNGAAGTIGVNSNITQVGGASVNTDPCGSTGIAKLSTFKNITTATTTALVVPSGSTNIFVCGLSMDISSTTASTVIFENGTGAACATSPNALTHTFTNSTAVNSYKFYGGGLMTIFATGTSQGLCALTTVGTSPTIGITITYVQQ